jgi:fucose permease
MPARRATTTVFFLTGVTFASFASRIPALQDRLDLSPGQLSLAFLALNGGAVAGLPGGSVLARRAGGRASLPLGFAVYPPGLIAVALAPGLGWLCLVLAVMAAANSVIDVATNV